MVAHCGFVTLSYTHLHAHEQKLCSFFIYIHTDHDIAVNYAVNVKKH